MSSGFVKVSRDAVHDMLKKRKTNQISGNGIIDSKNPEIVVVVFAKATITSMVVLRDGKSVERGFSA